MASFTTPATNTENTTNTVHGDRELVVTIRDIANARGLAQEVVELRQQAAMITSIHVNATTYFQALEEQEDADPNFRKPIQDWGTDSIAASLCEPLSDLLTAVECQGGGLKTFSWDAANHTDRKFTRPPSFWKALFAHASTLENLHLDFFCHEVLSLQPPPPSGWLFPKLKTLRLDTSSAHGDNGTVVDLLLHACPNLEKLHFEWPPCNLDNCQIQNISWSWTYPELKSLYVFGWNFAFATYTDFLTRHPSILSLEERVNGPYDSSGFGFADVRLPSTSLPNLETLKKEFTTTHSLRDYFDPAASRPISTLAIHTHTYYGAEQDLLDITTSPTAQKTLRTLEFLGSIKCWRDLETDFASDDGSDAEIPPMQESETNRLPDILQTVIPDFLNLETLSIEMDSSNATWDSESQAFSYPDPMNARDLTDVFELLPKSCEGKLRLLKMKDSRANEDTLEEFLEYLADQIEGLEVGESTTGSLQELVWSGEKESVFDISQVDAKYWAAGVV